VKTLVFFSLTVAGLVSCHCGATQVGAAPTPGDDTCILPLVANCLNTDAGIVTCEGATDKSCGVVAGRSAQLWAGVVQAEEIQGFVVKGQ
jgi:hypothetical protein